MTDGNLFVLPSECFDAGAGTNRVLDHLTIDGQSENPRHAEVI